MKRLRSVGHGVTSKQAEPLTIEEENQLWEQGLLGDHSPQTLLDTMDFDKYRLYLLKTCIARITCGSHAEGFPKSGHMYVTRLEKPAVFINP